MKDLGTRFPDMSEPFKIELINKAKKIADELGINMAKVFMLDLWVHIMKLLLKL